MSNKSLGSDRRGFAGSGPPITVARAQADRRGHIEQQDKREHGRKNVEPGYPTSRMLHEYCIDFLCYHPALVATFELKNLI
jgi:hypothetical protein